MSGSDVQGWLENGSKLLNYTVTFHPVALAACVFWSSGLKELLLRLRSSQVKKWLRVWSNLNLWPVRSDHRCDVNSARWQHHSGYVSRYSKCELFTQWTGVKTDFLKCYFKRMSQFLFSHHQDATGNFTLIGFFFQTSHVNNRKCHIIERPLCLHQLLTCFNRSRSTWRRFTGCHVYLRG